MDLNVSQTSSSECDSSSKHAWNIIIYIVNNSDKVDIRIDSLSQIKVNTFHVICSIMLLKNVINYTIAINKRGGKWCFIGLIYVIMCDIINWQ